MVYNRRTEMTIETILKLIECPQKIQYPYRETGEGGERARERESDTFYLDVEFNLFRLSLDMLPRL